MDSVTSQNNKTPIPAVSSQSGDMDAYSQLFRCLQHLADAASNPVMEVLRGIDPVEQDRKYPEPGLSFSGIGIRAFYHCHDAVTAPANEHGHFHLFLHRGGDHESLTNWAHLAGLSMDLFGQPLRWFTVNRWVSGGPWLDTPQLLELLRQLHRRDDLALVEEWLVAMLAVFQAELSDLLVRRDQRVSQLITTSNKQAILDDRGYYEFSTCAIDLLLKFQQL